MATKKTAAAVDEAELPVEESAAASAAETTTPTGEKKPDGNAAGFCVYLGPTILGVIQSGTIYPGDREKALAAIAPAVERYPTIAHLVVTGDTLPEDRIKVKTPGNLLYVHYRQLASGKKK